MMKEKQGLYTFLSVAWDIYVDHMSSWRGGEEYQRYNFPSGHNSA